MTPMSYHSWREKLGNYLQIKVMLSDSSPHMYTTSVRGLSLRWQRQTSKNPNEIREDSYTNWNGSIISAKIV